MAIRNIQAYDSIREGGGGTCTNAAVRVARPPNRTSAACKCGWAECERRGLSEFPG